MKPRRLEILREKMKGKDKEIIRLLNERSRISVEIGKVKGEGGIQVYDPAQEAKVHGYLQDLNPGPLPQKALTAIFREVISASRDLQRPTTIAFLGPEASFSHLASRLHFGESSRFFPQTGISRVFDEVEKGSIDWGVVPVENSLEGSVNTTLDRLITTTLKIRAEIYLRISQCLISSAKNMKDIKKIYSHPQALAQCQVWLRTNLPNCVLNETESTAAAVQMVRGKKNEAAIGSSLAGKIYGLSLLAEGIEDNSSNMTRFLVIGRGESEASGNDKTSLIFATPHSPGSLHSALSSFARRKINLAKIESHPVKEKLWEYSFFVDMIGHITDKDVKNCLRELKKKTTFLKILGSYPKNEGTL
ncbi:MAG: prephenate dehydratase [Deltaproteobacteria bacterium HGW-Deltaproteobacteria-7]|jgi:chorismate mutase/prephenate dehydratase|nr:MAG: prephenate dehydratase [Deltaproteobacteria bacterium HGW-Deltaproteobacteria-7]PKN52573.1 MAG: prephenate dehydratase [Deltaproteobacteria bacterium HGW-Deltaproteobacteria-13]